MMSSQTRKPAHTPVKKTKSVTKSVKENKKPHAATTASTAPNTMFVSAAENNDEQVEVRIPAAPQWVRLVRLAAAGVASVLNFSIEEIEDIKLAVAEACNNAILHAQPTRASQGASQNTPLPTILVTLIPARDYIEIRVQDEGRLTKEIVSPAAKIKKSEASDYLPEGGLGLLIMQSVMDEVRYSTGEDTNTTLCMVKYRHPGKSQAKR